VKDITFLQKARIKEILRSIPEATHVRIDRRAVTFVDRDVDELLFNFSKEADRHQISFAQQFEPGGEERFSQRVSDAPVHSHQRQAGQAMPDETIDEAARLLLQNKAWAQLKNLQDPQFFRRLAANQSPRVLWIGCSDSRVPADAITGTQPGEIFVHRNIANVVVHTDLNLLSVLAYAVNELKVDHVMVVGHHGCGGVRAAMTDKDYGLLNEWLRNIKEVYAANADEVNAIADPSQRENRLAELNVISQVMNLAKTSIIQKAWQQRQGPTLHAWVYDLADGILHELKTITFTSMLPYPFHLNVE
jgi:carbonic anhydrase